MASLEPDVTLSAMLTKLSDLHDTLVENLVSIALNVWFETGKLVRVLHYENFLVG